MEIAVLGNTPNSSFDDLVKAAGERHRLTFVSWENLNAHVGGHEMVTAGDKKYEICLVRGMPHGSLEQVIFRMNVLARWQCCGVRVFNSPESLEIAIDKYLSLALIRQAGLTVPESIVCQTVESAMDAFEKLGRDVIVKPVFGGEGNGMIRLTESETALRSFRAIASLNGVIFQQRYIECNHRDLRLFVIGNRVFAMKRSNPDDWRANASRGARCEKFALSQSLIDMARTAAKAVGTSIAGVDVIIDEQGNPFVLEVNGVPGWQHISKACNIDVAAMIIDLIVKPESAWIESRHQDVSTGVALASSILMSKMTRNPEKGKKP